MTRGARPQRAGLTTEASRLRSRWVAVALGLTLVAAATVAAPAAAGSRDFQTALDVTSTIIPCSADMPPNSTECRALTVQTPYSFAGLGSLSNPYTGVGSVSESTYTLPLGLGPPTCPAGLGKPLATTGRLSVGGMGELAFALSEGARCVRSEEAWEEPQTFTITGGTGTLAAASGRGTLVRGDPLVPEEYDEIWTGTLTVPRLHFTAPKLSGAVAKTVRAAKGAKGARVTFEVTATDDEGGATPVSCDPPSGSRFPLGKTTVRCWATDASGNTGFARFAVTVKRRR